MLKNFFINAIRNMRKQRGYVLLNVGGLAIGLTSFIFITLYVIHELSYDRFHKNYENIYSIKVVGRLAGGVLDQAVACIGLLGLVTYITNKRTREIGIRKTYGASINVVLRLLSKEVVYLILISSVIAYPIAYYGSKFWLEGS